MLYVLLWVTLCPFKFCNHLDGEERAGCFTKFVLLVSRVCCVALPCEPWGCLQFVIVVFPDHTHLLLLQTVASDLGLCYLSMTHKKNVRLTWVKYFCCLCNSHQLYYYFIELNNDWISN